MKDRSYFVYILRCADSSYYTGVTNDVERRLYEHQEGMIRGCYTHDRRPVKLLYAEEFSDIIDALNREKQLKKWSRAKKEALMKGDFMGLKQLSRGKPLGPSTSSG